MRPRPFGDGMVHGGRVLPQEKEFLPEHKD